MENSLPQQQTQPPAPKPKKSFKKLIVVIAAGLLLLGGAVAAFVIVSQPGRNGKKEETQKVEEAKPEAVIAPASVRTYRIVTPQAEVSTSFVYIGDPISLFNPLSAYYLTKDNRLLAIPLYVSASTVQGTPWCLGNGRDPQTASLDQASFFCLENIGNKTVTLRKADIRRNEYKEYTFSSNTDIFTDSRTSRVFSSKDGDSALLYSPSGSFIFESNTGNLFRMDFPLNLDFVNSVQLSNVEAALFTSNNKVYRVNFSNHGGGLFDVNFIGFSPDQLSKALKTTRLSKDGRRLTFTISDPVSQLPPDKSLNFQNITAYNIDLGSAKVSDELNLEEKFLLSCSKLISSRYCFYTYTEVSEDKKTESLVLYVKEFDIPLTEAHRARKAPNATIDVNSQIQSPLFAFFKAPYFFSDTRDPNKFFWVYYTYDIAAKASKPLMY